MILIKKYKNTKGKSNIEEKNPPIEYINYKNRIEPLNEDNNLEDNIGNNMFV